MVFNVLCGNRDDHLMNHALNYDGRDWRLSPAFDIVLQPDMQPAYAISLGVSGVYGSIANCVSCCQNFGLSTENAHQEIGRIAHSVKNWRDAFIVEGVAPVTLGRIASAFKIAEDWPRGT